MATTEVNFDGLIGPTHHYAGLSFGNLASQRHRLAVSNPREAALQGLAKMKFLTDLGLKQGVIPPLERPDIATLRRLGFGGTNAQVIAKAAKDAPLLLAACYSASSMWAANAATVSPSADTGDGRVHFTPANLASQFHRSLETESTGAILRRIFHDEAHFAHHAALPASQHLGDEGAANHMRLCPTPDGAGIEVFVYGRSGFDVRPPGPARFPARQSLEASQAVARLHQLDPNAALFIRQSPEAIDAGAFHNDVVAVSNQNVLLHHAQAFADGPTDTATIREAYRKAGGADLHLIEVPAHVVPLADAVRSYLFNSQLVSTADGMALICPVECREIASSRRFLEELLQRQTPIRAVHFIDVRQSMNNGGGPACLRLRVALTGAELSAVAPGVLMTDVLYTALVDWVTRHYRDRLTAEDLADPKLVEESRRALDELTHIVQLVAIYPFQRGQSDWA